jgi:hypothetical protein
VVAFTCPVLFLVEPSLYCQVALASLELNLNVNLVYGSKRRERRNVNDAGQGTKHSQENMNFARMATCLSSEGIRGTDFFMRFMLLR